MKIDARTGRLQGTPSQRDVSLSPLTVTVVADDGRGGGAQSTFLLVIARDLKQPKQESFFPLVKAVLGQRFELAIGSYFSPINGGPLRFSLLGLGPGSGVSIVSTTGILSGVPTQNDLIASQSGRRPIPLTISVTDGGGPALEVLYSPVYSICFNTWCLIIIWPY
jgi:hypothetical protein